MLNRSLWVWVHRWAGLYMAAFLVVAGLTGSVLAFAPELQGWLVPPVRVAERGVPMLDGLALRERALALVGSAYSIDSVDLHRAPRDPYTAWVIPRKAESDGASPEAAIDHIRLDPYTGEEIERSHTPQHGLWPITRHNAISVIVALHYRLAVPGSIGAWLFGVAALLWTIDCFVSVYLTFPIRVRRATHSRTPGRWLRRWWDLAWLVKWRGSAYRVVFDVHRASGLWLWVLMLALAWSSVGFNLRHQVYLPVMEGVFAYRDIGHELVPLPQPRPDPATSWPQALQRARRLMSEQALAQHFSVSTEMSLDYRADTGTWWYWVRSDRDIIDTSVMTYLVFDDTDGHYIGIVLPTGDRLGNTINAWVGALHLAMLWGLPYKVFLAFAGIVVAALSISGVLIWQRKRNAQMVRRQRHGGASVPMPSSSEGGST